MDSSLVLGSLLIIVSRIADVSLGTLRTVFIVSGRRVVAFLVGFVEVLIWVVVVSSVVKNFHQPAYVVSYALGFALGTYAGMTFERWLQLGDQMIRLFTRRGAEMAAALREIGFVVTEIPGMGRDGPVSLLFLETKRRMTSRALEAAEEIDSTCYFVVDDVRTAAPRNLPLYAPTGWRGIAKKK